MNTKTQTLLDAREKLMGIIQESTQSYIHEVETALKKMKVVSEAILQEADTDLLTSRIVELRDLKSSLKASLDTVNAVIEMEVVRTDTKLLELMDLVGASSIKAEGGTAYIQTKSRYNCSDWEVYYSYIKEHDRFDLLEKRPAQGALKKLQEEEGELPPGISTFSERTVTVRRS